MKEEDFFPRQVAIFGLGLMGASLAMALRPRCEIWGSDIQPTVLAAALERGIIQRQVALAEALSADLLVLATPVRAILSMLENLARLSPPRPLTVLDLGSTKQQIVEAMKTLPDGYEPIGGHPMCGKETGGLASADAALYRGCRFLLVPVEGRAAPRARAHAEWLIRALDAIPLELNAANHDRLTALVSHLPYLSAVALRCAALTDGDARLGLVAASGFRDSSRLADSPPQMALDILLTNRDAILLVLQSLQEQLHRLRLCLEAADETALSEIIHSASPFPRQ
jgi:prephenate dehydrogenase